jgi:transposase
MVRQYTYAYGAVCPEDGASSFLILPRMDKASLDVFLRHLAKTYAGHAILVIYDGAPSHRAHNLKVPTNIMLATLPPYCPQLNPVENIWDDMRERFFDNLVFHSMNAVIDRLSLACRKVMDDPLRTKSITAWDWIINSLFEN